MAGHTLFGSLAIHVLILHNRKGFMKGSWSNKGMANFPFVGKHFSVQQRTTLVNCCMGFLNFATFNLHFQKHTAHTVTRGSVYWRTGDVEAAGGAVLSDSSFSEWTSWVSFRVGLCQWGIATSYLWPIMWSGNIPEVCMFVLWVVTIAVNFFQCATNQPVLREIHDVSSLWVRHHNHDEPCNSSVCCVSPATLRSEG